MKILILIICILFFSGCSKYTWWPEINSEEKCKNKFKSDGHITSAHIVIMAARQCSSTNLSCERYALFSQVPDAQWFRFSAPAVSIWATLLPWELDYRFEINSILHSLHGGNKSEIEDRRNKLINLIKKYSNNNLSKDDWKVGFLIHALGDSYAHVYDKGNGIIAYNHIIGHLVEKGDYSPDSIYQNFDNYILYVNALYSALYNKNSNYKEFKNFIVFLENIRIDLHKYEIEDRDTFIFEELTTYRKSKNSLLNYCKHKDWANKVTKSKVEKFLKKMKNDLI